MSTRRLMVVVAAVLHIDLVAEMQVTEIHLSTDLTRLGIAAQNMVPDHVLRYDLLPGFRDPTDFSHVRPQSNAVLSMYALVYRDGQLLANTGRMRIAMPTEPGIVHITEPGAHASMDVMRTFETGDTLVIVARDIGGGPFTCANCTDVTIRDMDVYTSTAIGLIVSNGVRALVERVRVIPRPDSTRLISSVADGIMLADAREANTVRACEIRGTGDDGIAVNHTAMAFVDGVEGTTAAATANWGSRPLTADMPVLFVNGTSGSVVGEARVLAVDPAGQINVGGGGRPVRLSFDRPVPVLARDSFVIRADVHERGERTVVEGNLVADAFMARGIYIAGVTGVTVRHNQIVRGPSAGILVNGTVQRGVFTTGPADRIDIIGNRIEDAIRPNRDGNSGSSNAFGAIQIIQHVSGLSFPTSARSIRQIRIEGNVITGAGRSGIWASNVDGLAIQHNTIDRQGLFTSAPIYGWPSSDFAQLRQEFGQPIATRDAARPRDDRRQAILEQSSSERVFHGAGDTVTRRLR